MAATDEIEKGIARAARTGGLVNVPLMINSDMAQALLDRNAHNRPLRERRAARYRQDMLAGAWGANGETLKVDTEGRLVDGQHRCAAIEGTELAIPMLVVFGVAPEAAVTIDQGAARNAGDYLQMRGISNAATVARIARLRLAYETNERAALNDISKLTNAQVLRYFEEHQDDVLRSAEVVAGLRDYAQPLVAASVLGFVHNVVREINADDAERYVQQVAKGEEIQEGNAAFAVRTRLLKMGKAGAARKAEVLLVGWNAYHHRRQLKNIRLTGKLPQLAA